MKVYSVSRGRQEQTRRWVWKKAPRGVGRDQLKKENFEMKGTHYFSLEEIARGLRVSVESLERILSRVSLPVSLRDGEPVLSQEQFYVLRRRIGGSQAKHRKMMRLRVARNSTPRGSEKDRKWRQINDPFGVMVPPDKYRGRTCAQKRCSNPVTTGQYLCPACRARRGVPSTGGFDEANYTDHSSFTKK